MSLEASQSITLSRQTVIALVRDRINPDPDNPLPHGPGDPVIRRALERLAAFGPQPEPWQRLARVALNPQPLPPRLELAVAAAEEAVDRFTLMQEIADAMAQAGSESGAQRGIIIVGGAIARFIDDCGNGLISRWHPKPPPRRELDGRFEDAFELIAMAVVFEARAAGANDGLKDVFGKAGARLAELGLGRMSR